MIAARTEDLTGSSATRIVNGVRPSEEFSPKIEGPPEAGFAVRNYKGDVGGFAADTPLIGEYGEMEIRIIVGHVGMVVVTLRVDLKRHALARIHRRTPMDGVRTAEGGG